MSCIGVNIDRTDRVSASVKREGAISIQAERIESIKVTVSVICDIGRYLIVTPAFLWMTDWDSEIVDVKSNTKWNVE